MAPGIDEKRHVVHENHPRHSRDQESAQRAGPPAPEPAQQRRESKAGEAGDEEVMPVLPPNQWVRLKVFHAFQRRGRTAGHYPTDMRVEEALRDVVRVLSVVDELVVLAVVRGPRQNGVLEGGAPKMSVRRRTGQRALKVRWVNNR